MEEVEICSTGELVLVVPLEMEVVVTLSGMMVHGGFGWLEEAATLSDMAVHVGFV